MRYFPIFIDLADKSVLVVGGGEEALRKIRLLLKTPAQITVLAQELHPELHGNPRVIWQQAGFSPDLLNGIDLVYVAEAELAATVSEAARARAIPVNVIDQAELSSFLTPALIDRDPVVIAIGTEGAAPVLAQGLRARIDALLPLNLGALTEKARGWRQKVAELIPAGRARRLFWQKYFFGAKREEAAEAELIRLLAAHHEAGALQGQISLIAACAGDRDLITLKAQRRLMEADLILYADDLNADYLEMARRDAVRASFNAAQGFLPLLERCEQALRQAQQLVILISHHADYHRLAAVIAARKLDFEAIPFVTATTAGQDFRPEEMAAHKSMVGIKELRMCSTATPSFVFEPSRPTPSRSLGHSLRHETGL